MKGSDMKEFEVIIRKIPLFIQGEWIRKNSGYEAGLCDCLGWKQVLTRYFDAVTHGFKIEIKKGKSIWLDLVRYSEIVTGDGDLDTITAFFIPNDKKTEIEHIYFVKTDSIIRFLGLDKEHAEQIIKLKDLVPRQLNCQTSMTVSDVKKLAFYTHDTKGILFE